MLLHHFKEYIRQHKLFQQNDRLLLAVSGGVDSVVLCELCHQAGYDFAIAHCNFQLRGEESERDEAFVRTLGEKYKVEVVIKKFDTDSYVKQTGLSIQVAARDLRYNWFKEIISDTTYNPRKAKAFIVTAHHANDSVETMLMNFFKGTGVKGLQGIKPVQEERPYLVRPLLFAKKEDLLLFAKDNNLDFVEDSSNSTDKYTRNYFRNQLLPSIKKVYPEVENNLIDNLGRFSEIEMLYFQAIEQHKKKLVEKKKNEFHIPVLKLLKTEPLQTVLYEIIKEFGFSSHQVSEAVALLKSDTGKYIQSTTHRIIKNRKWLIIAPSASNEAQHILIEENDNTVVFEKGILEINTINADNYKLQAKTAIAQFDAEQIHFPLLLRKWKQGDYFYPLGMQKKKKKISRFLIDQKLSLPQKENTWILEMNKKIIWVAGVRIDDRFKITASTSHILKLELKEKQ